MRFSRSVANFKMNNPSNLKLYVGTSTDPNKISVTDFSVTPYGDSYVVSYTPDFSWTKEYLNTVNLTGIQDNVGNVLGNVFYKFNYTTDISLEPIREIVSVDGTNHILGNCDNATSPSRCYSRFSSVIVNLTFNETMNITDYELWQGIEIPYL